MVKEVLLVKTCTLVLRYMFILKVHIKYVSYLEKFTQVDSPNDVPCVIWRLCTVESRRDMHDSNLHPCLNQYWRRFWCECLLVARYIFVHFPLVCVFKPTAATGDEFSLRLLRYESCLRIVQRCVGLVSCCLNCLDTHAWPTHCSGFVFTFESTVSEIFDPMYVFELIYSVEQPNQYITWT